VRIRTRTRTRTQVSAAHLPPAGLAGDRKGTYAVTVSGNWRITFRFDGKDAIDVDLEDYH